MTDARSCGRGAPRGARRRDVDGVRRDDADSPQRIARPVVEAGEDGDERLIALDALPHRLSRCGGR